MKILGAAISNCIHVAGIVNYLALAQKMGFETLFMGPAVSVVELIEKAKEYNPDVIDIGYRLSPETASVVIKELITALDEAQLTNKMLVFGGTPPVCHAIEKLRYFDIIFDSSEPSHLPISSLRSMLNGCTKLQLRALSSGNASVAVESGTYKSRRLTDRIDQLKPYPLLRHHFGLPDISATYEGIRRIAEAQVLDIISIGPDQNAQEHFFHPSRMAQEVSGAGGAPIRTREHLTQIAVEASRGNHPLLRCYSGTNDQLEWAEMLNDTISNAWAAIPLMWYSELDGRSKRPLVEAIKENQSAIGWHAVRGIPVEVNESHHWSLRDAHDAIAVAMAYIAALNAKSLGVKDYIAQLMLNTPPNIGFSADLGKMLAKLALVGELEEDGVFRVWRQVRAGLMSFSTDLDIAKGQLASSVLQGLMLKPDIIHVVGHSEADHAATAEDVIISCKIARGVIKNSLSDLPNIGLDPRIDAIKTKLIKDARTIIDSISSLGSLTDPTVLAEAVRIGLIDTPHFVRTTFSLGALKTGIVDGCCVPLDSSGRIMSEEKRIRNLHIS